MYAFWSYPVPGFFKLLMAHIKHVEPSCYRLGDANSQYTLSIITSQLHCFQLRTILNGKNFIFFLMGYAQRSRASFNTCAKNNFGFWSRVYYLSLPHLLQSLTFQDKTGMVFFVMLSLYKLKWGTSVTSIITFSGCSPGPELSWSGKTWWTDH